MRRRRLASDVRAEPRKIGKALRRKKTSAERGGGVEGAQPAARSTFPLPAGGAKGQATFGGGLRGFKEILCVCHRCTCAVVNRIIQASAAPGRGAKREEPHIREKSKEKTERNKTKSVMKLSKKLPAPFVSSAVRGNKRRGPSRKLLNSFKCSVSHSLERTSAKR